MKYTPVMNNLLETLQQAIQEGADSGEGISASEVFAMLEDKSAKHATRNMDPFFE